MSYFLSFLPEVEDDAIEGFMWYEQKSKGWVKTFLEFPMHVQAKYNIILFQSHKESCGTHKKN
jgi:hypothetical protein